MGSQTVGRDLGTEQEQTCEHRVKLWSGRGRPGSVSSTETPLAASCGCCGPDAGLAGAAGAMFSSPGVWRRGNVFRGFSMPGPGFGVGVGRTSQAGKTQAM